MKYENSEIISQLAAEYVVGTLDGPARRRLETLLASNAKARAQVDFWTVRLADFGQALEPLEPPAEVRRTLVGLTAPTSPYAQAQPFRSRRRRLIVASAAAMIGQHNPVKTRAIDPEVAGIAGETSLSAKASPALLADTGSRETSPFT